MAYAVKNSFLYNLTQNNDWEQVEFFPTSNQGDMIQPRFLVIHYTAGAADARATAQYYQKPEAKVSAHLTLDKDGTFVQSVELNRKAWHAGKSEWAGFSDLNTHSIGIEVINPGPLTISANGGFQTWWGKTVTDPNIIVAPHPNDPNGPTYGWIPFTEQQVNALIEVGQIIMQEFGLQECVGHDMIAPGRKTDPGPCMNYRVYDHINAYAAGTQGSWEWYVANVNTSLNGRSGPGSEHSVVKELPKGTTLEILKRQGIWWNVETEMGEQMWVHSKFLGTRKVNV
jgi:N-acetylmuramoyl-L-alanine amidase